MIENRMKELRVEKLMSTKDIAKRVGTSKSTISRYENNLVTKLDLSLLEQIADAIGTSAAYLLGMTDDSYYTSGALTEKYFENEALKTVLVTDDRMAPAIPEGAYVKIRDFKPNEELTAGSFYHVEFNDMKCFRMAVADPLEGISLMPLDMSEQRIAYDKEYVKFIGKAVMIMEILEDE